MRDLGFRADLLNDSGRASFVLKALLSASSSTIHTEVKTKSGRNFKYNLSKYDFGPDLSPAQARSLAREIALEKYMPADWDWQHSREQAIDEISESLLQKILQCVAKMHARDSEPDNSD